MKGTTRKKVRLDPWQAPRKLDAENLERLSKKRSAQRMEKPNRTISERLPGIFSVPLIETHHRVAASIPRQELLTRTGCDRVSERVIPLTPTSEGPIFEFEQSSQPEADTDTLLMRDCSHRIGSRSDLHPSLHEPVQPPFAPRRYRRRAPRECARVHHTE